MGLRRATAKRRDETIDLAELDRRLDVPVDEWDKQVKRVVRDLRSKSVGVEIPDSVSLEQVVGQRISWSRLYERQVRTLPRMDRAEEFAMARRYEFMKERLRDALLRVGYPKAEVEQLVLQPRPSLPECSKVGPVAHLKRCRREFEALRNLYVESSLHLVFSKVNRYRSLGVDELDLIQEANSSLFNAIEGFDWRRDVRFNTYAQYWIHQAILKNLYDASRTVRLPVWIQKAHRKIQKARDAHYHATGAWPTVEQVAERVELPADRVEEILGARRSTVSLDRPSFGDDDGSTYGQLVPDESVPPIEERASDGGDLAASLSDVMSGLPAREKVILERRFGLTGDEPETLAEIADDFGITAERVRQLQNNALQRLQKPDVRRRLRVFAG